MSSHSQSVTMRVSIEGRVQGVGYRTWTEHQANRLGLDGWVRNCRDGTVEAEFHGPLEVVKQMLEECHEGPLAAKVEAVRAEATEGVPAKGFEVRKTE